MKWLKVALGVGTIALLVGTVSFIRSAERLPTPVDGLTVSLTPGAPTDTLDLRVDWTPSVVTSDSILGYRVHFWVDGVLDSNSVFSGNNMLTSWVFRAPPTMVGSIAEYRLGVQAQTYSGLRSEFSYYMIRRQGPGALTAATTIQPEFHIQMQPGQFVADSFAVLMETYPDGGTTSTGKQSIAMLRSVADSVIILPLVLRGDRHAFFLVPYLVGLTIAPIHLGQITYSRQ